MHTRKQQRTIPDLAAIIEGLIKAEIEFILVGGFAAVTQGAPITTMAVDIVHEQSPENIARLHSFLMSIDAIHRRPDDKIRETPIRIPWGIRVRFPSKTGISGFSI